MPHRRPPLEALRKLTARHKDFFQTADVTRPLNCNAPDSIPFDVSLLHLPKAASIAPALEAAGLSPSTAIQVSDVYLRTAHQLRDACQSSFQNAYAKAKVEGHLTNDEARGMAQAWSSAYTRQTHAWMENALSRARNTVAQTMASTIPCVKERKPVFNHEYTPLLEKYFQYNAYPSAPDRAVLARKSMMTPRQIEVWFQNHRNRAKKEGKVLRKLTNESLPSELSLDSLKREMPFFVMPLNEQKQCIKADNSSDDEATVLANTTPHISTTTTTYDAVVRNDLDPPRPSHAFPTVYTKQSDDCFTGTYKFPAPCWYRKPAARCQPPQTRIDMAEFILEFNQKLHLRGPEVAHHLQNSQSWCSSRYTPICPAPLPALIRPLTSPVRQPSVLMVTTPRPPASRSPSPSTLAPTFVTPHNQTPARRKVTRLPKRTPTQTSVVHQRSTPPIPESSSSPSNSRTSSHSSYASSRRPSSSSSSSSSSSPTTPVLSISALPGDPQSSCISVSGVDFDFTDDDTRSLQMERPFAFSETSQPKQPSTFGFSLSDPHLSRRYPNWSLGSSS